MAGLFANFHVPGPLFAYPPGPANLSPNNEHDRSVIFAEKVIIFKSRSLRTQQENGRGNERIK